LVVLLCKLANLSFFILGAPNRSLRVLLAMIPLTAILLNFLGQILYFTTVDTVAAADVGFFILINAFRDSMLLTSGQNLLVFDLVEKNNIFHLNQNGLGKLNVLSYFLYVWLDCELPLIDKFAREITCWIPLVGVPD